VLWLITINVYAQQLNNAQIVQLLSGELEHLITIETVSMDTAIYPGSNARVSIRLQNNSLDTLRIKSTVQEDVSWKFIYPMKEKAVLPETSALFTYLIQTKSSDSAGSYTITFYYAEINTTQQFIHKAAIKLKKKRLIRVYPMDIPVNISVGSVNQAVFGVENAGNTTEAISVFLIGSNTESETIMKPGDQREYISSINVPKTYNEESIQSGCIVTVKDKEKAQISSVKPIRVYRSQLKPDKATNQSQILLSQQAGISSNGYNNVYRSASRLRLSIGQQSLKKLNATVSSMSTLSTNRQLTNSRVLVTKGFGNAKHQFTLKGGVITPATPFYARLPRNFIGSSLSYSNLYFESQTVGMINYVLSAADSVERVAVQDFRITRKKFEIESKNLAYQSGGVPYLITRNTLKLNPLKTLEIKGGVHLFNRALINRLAYEFELTGGSRNFGYGGSFLKTPSVFTPGNSLITMTDASVSRRTDKYSFSLNGSLFEQGSPLTANTISRRSFSSFNSVSFSPYISVDGAFMYFQSLNQSANTTFEIVNQSIDLQINKSFLNQNRLSINYKNQFTDQKTNSVLNRNEIALTGEIRKGNAAHIVESRFEKSSFVNRSRLSYQTIFPIAKNVRFSSVSSLNYQPTLRIDKYFSTTGEVRYTRGQSELGLSFNTSINNNSPNMFSVLGRGTLRLALPRRSDRFLKTLEINVVDHENKAVPNVLITIDDDVLITDENGYISIKTLTHDSVALFVQPRTLPFGSMPIKGLQQRLLTPSKTNHVTIQLTYVNNIIGKSIIQPGDVPIPVKPRFYNFTVKLSNGAETVLRPIADDGSFSASGLANGTWKAEVISKDPNYKAFTVINPISSKELENGDLWKLSIIFKETKGKINIQRGIEK